MRILHLALGGCLKAPPVNYGITADTGGHIAYVLDAAFAQAQQADVDHVTIVTRAFEEARLPADHALASQAIAAKISIDRVPTANTRYLEKEALAQELPRFSAAFCEYLARQIRLPDVIHAHFADAAEVAIAARRRFGIRLVYTPHALGIDKRRNVAPNDALGDTLSARIEQERCAIASADGIIVSSRDEADRQIGAYGVRTGDRVHRIAPGVPCRPPQGRDSTLVDRLERGLDRPELPIVLAIARPVRKKNLAALVRAFATTPALRERANLVILAGQRGGASCCELGEEEQAVVTGLYDQIATHGLAGHVAMPERHDAADVTALYARAAAGGVFVNPALHEPFGLTLIEAAAAGVPVVATRNGGPQEIVPTIGHGVLIDPLDDAAIGAACLRILTDRELHAALSAAGTANVGRYDWTRYAQESCAVYRSIARWAQPRPALLACDIDNTLTGCRRSARTFARWHERTGMPFIIATGRSFDDASAVLRQWELPEPDAYVVDVGTRIMRRAATGRWSECADYAARLDRAWDRPAIVAALRPLAIIPQPASTEGPHKISFFGGLGEVTRIRQELAEAGLSARVILSHGRLIDVIAPSGGKAAAIAAYAASIGLSREQCIAAGDSGNDADMLDACGDAIVVGNADDELAGLAPRPGLYRARLHHAAGVLEGLARVGLILPVTPTRAPTNPDPADAAINSAVAA